MMVFIRRYERNDEEWEKIPKILFPERKAGTMEGPYKDIRTTVNSILRIARDGALW